MADGAQGVVELFPEFTPGLLDLADFERLWLIYVLDRASTAQLITRPYLDNQEHGIFATLDGTPLLDIKPYVPAFVCFEVSRTGWYAGKSASSAVLDTFLTYQVQAAPCLQQHGEENQQQHRAWKVCDRMVNHAHRTFVLRGLLPVSPITKCTATNSVS